MVEPPDLAGLALALVLWAFDLWCLYRVGRPDKQGLGRIADGAGALLSALVSRLGG